MPSSIVSRTVGALLAVTATVLACSGEAVAPPPVNGAPVAVIGAPAAGATFRAGDAIAYSGTGSDQEDGAIPPARLAWWVELWRGSQVERVVPRTVGQPGGAVTVPMRGLGADARYRIYLEVRDADGLADTAMREVSPLTSMLRFESQPSGLRFSLDGATLTTPYEVSGLVGLLRDLDIASPQVLGTSQWAFGSWSDGGARAHTIVTGAASSTWVATFTLVPPPNQAPTVTLTAPAGGASLTRGTPIALAAAASDADGAVTQVEFFVGGTSVGIDQTAPFGVSWTPGTTGPASITARATDDDGASTTSAAVAVTVIDPPNHAPQVALTAPVGGSTLSVNVATTLGATATDADGTIARVEFLDGGTVLGSDTQAPYELVWTPTTLGTHVITARAFDDDGASTTSAAASVTVQAQPNQAPSVTLTAPTAGATIVLGSTVSLAATAADADGTVTQVAFFAGTTSLGIDASAPYAASWTPTTAGTYALTARATDDDGAVTTSSTVTVTVQPPPNVAPTIAITAPASGATLTSGTPVTVRATASDVDGSVVQVVFLDGTTTIGTLVQPPYEVAWTPTTTGARVLTARATDDDGATTSATVTVTVAAPPNRPPVATITSPSANAPFRAGDTITYSGSGADPDDGAVPAARMTWWVDLHHDTHTHPLLPATSGVAGGTLVLPTTVETSDNIWYRFWLVVRDAAGAADTVFHDIQPVKVTMRFQTVPAGLQVTLEGQPRTAPLDVVGVVGTRRQLGAPSPQTLNGTQYAFTSWSDGGTATHDITTPAANTTYTATFTAVATNQPPVVAISAPAAGAILTAGSAVTVRATATDADGTVAQVAFFVDGAPLGNATASPFEVTWTPTVLGPHVLTARATDDDGDVTTSSAVSVTVQGAGGGDVTAPTAQLLAPANDARNLGGSILVRASASDNVGVAGVTFQLDGEPIGPEDTSAPYEVTIPSTAAYTTGQHVIRARARDAAGNVSQWATATVGFGGAVDLPAGFARTAYVSGLGPPTAMAFAPDGRLFIAEQGGALRVVKDGVLLATPFYRYPTVADGESGLLGVAFDPDFATNRWVYALFTAKNPNRNMVVRVRAAGDVADAATMDTVFVLPNLSALFHVGGALHFGPDRRLYLTAGDNFNSANAQSLSSVFGKMLRIEADGTIPADNPFVAQTTGINRAIWALGLRNPFTFGFQPGTGRLFINDVGQNAWEEINEGVAGANYGWPATEGYTTNAAYRSPLYAYSHSSTIVQGFSIVGAAWYHPSTPSFGASYVGDYFFGDYGSGWVNRMDVDNEAAVYAFARFPGAFIVNVATGPDGAIYVLGNGVNGGWGVWRVQRTP